MRENPPAGAPLKGGYVFRIYLASGAPNSVRALSNLYALCRKHYPDSHRIEIVNILEEPMRALADGIVVTPTIVKLSPAPQQQIFGNLSDEDEVLLTLGLPLPEHA